MTSDWWRIASRTKTGRVNGSCPERNGYLGGPDHNIAEGTGPTEPDAVSVFDISLNEKGFVWKQNRIGRNWFAGWSSS